VFIFPTTRDPHVSITFCRSIKQIELCSQFVRILFDVKCIHCDYIIYHIIKLHEISIIKLTKILVKLPQVPNYFTPGGGTYIILPKVGATDNMVSRGPSQF